MRKGEGEERKGEGGGEERGGGPEGEGRKEEKGEEERGGGRGRKNKEQEDCSSPSAAQAEVQLVVQWELLHLAVACPRSWALQPQLLEGIKN